MAAIDTAPGSAPVAPETSPRETREAGQQRPAAAAGAPENAPKDGETKPVTLATVGFADIAKNFVLLGWTAFGGPAAHVGLFQKIFVEQQQWMTMDVFTELFAVCQCMPGPSSTQMSFAIGTMKKGVLGGILSGILFQYPGFIILTIFGLTAQDWASEEVIKEHKWLAGMVGGLNASGVALVASASVGLWNKACGPPDAQILAGFCAVVLLYYTAELITPEDKDGRQWMWIFPCLIIFGGLSMYFWRGPLPKKEEKPQARDSGNDIENFGLGRIAGGILIAVSAFVFLATFVVTSILEYEDFKELFWFGGFWRTGAVIWGGGQVVLPLLENEVVPTGWVDSSLFFTGLALAQAMPGPLFNFAAFLGAATGRIAYDDVGMGILGAAICWLGLFGPGVMLIFGILPFWGKFRNNEIYKRALPGLNAAAVGLLVAAVVQMASQVRENNTKPDGPIPREASTCIGLVAFWGVHFMKLPSPVLTKLQAPIVVVAGGIAGLIAGVIDMK